MKVIIEFEIDETKVSKEHLAPEFYTVGRIIYSCKRLENWSTSLKMIKVGSKVVYKGKENSFHRAKPVEE